MVSCTLKMTKYLQSFMIPGVFSQTCCFSPELNELLDHKETDELPVTTETKAHAN